MECGSFVIVKFHIQKLKDGLFLPMIGGNITFGHLSYRLQQIWKFHGVKEMTVIAMDVNAVLQTKYDRHKWSWEEASGK